MEVPKIIHIYIYMVNIAVLDRKYPILLASAYVNTPSSEYLHLLPREII
jgi:hypothetical protein